MEYDVGVRLDALTESARERAIEGTAILRILEKVYKKEYDAAIAEIRQEASKQ